MAENDLKSKLHELNEEIRIQQEKDKQKAILAFKQWEEETGFTIFPTVVLSPHGTEMRIDFIPITK